jgi:tetratricopeptide (TPR) repeat protein
MVEDEMVEGEEAMTRNEVLDALTEMLPAELEIIMVKLDIPAGLISGAQAAQGTRAVEMTRWLESKSRLQEAVELLRSPRPSAAKTAVSIARLPSTGSKLFGRDAELAWLDSCWTEGTSVATVVAWGGVGKSALVNEWLARLGTGGWRGAERVYAWSFYSQGTSDSRNTSADLFVGNALRFFGDPEPAQGSPWDKGQRLARLIGRRRTLLILDGMEPLQAGPGVDEGKIRDSALQALVKELAGENKGLCLITTRIAMSDLGGGDKIRQLKLEHLSPEAGLELLKARRAKGTDAELREAAKEYGGHCLALTLLASYLDDVCQGDIRRRHEIGPLAGDERLGNRAQDVMAAYERWFDGGPEVAILRMLGLFDRPADTSEIAALRGAPGIVGLTDELSGLGELKWNKALSKLRRAGLLANSTDDRLDAHPLVREHFGAQVRKNSPAAWREGHGRLYEHLESSALPLPGTSEQMAPLLAAVVHGCLAERHDEAITLYWKRIQRGGDGFHWNRLGAFASEAIVLAAFFDPPWDNLADKLNERAKTRILNAAGFTLRALGRLQDAAKLMPIVLQRSVQTADWADAARDAGNLSDLHAFRGDLSAALATARQSIGYADLSGDPVQRTTKRATEGAVLHQMGCREEASACFAESERLRLEGVSAVALSLSLVSFRTCDFLLDEGRHVEAVANAEASLETATRDERFVAMGLAQLSLGRAYFHLGAEPSDGARSPARLLEQAVINMRRANRQDYLPRVLLARAELRIHSDDLPGAEQDIEEALSSAKSCGFRLYEADAHLGYARLLLVKGTSAPARDHLGRARNFINATGYHRRDEELARLTAALSPV